MLATHFMRMAMYQAEMGGAKPTEEGLGENGVASYNPSGELETMIIVCPSLS